MANSGFASSQPLSCDFLPDQAREDLALRLFGCLQLFELLDGQMKLNRFLHQPEYDIDAMFFEVHGDAQGSPPA
jgi:hypothetical protein